MACVLAGVSECDPPFIADPISIFTWVHNDDQVVNELRTCPKHGRLEATFLIHYINRTPGVIWRAVTNLL